ncbi:MAG: hypothetical protein L6R35_003524 [Caloplaca aegaea]|nr:MAG: hypothetical protein L6R35_003524 [Caloplaca aegaea]
MPEQNLQASSNMVVASDTRWMIQQANHSASEYSALRNSSKQHSYAWKLLVPVRAAAAVDSWISRMAAAVAAFVSQSVQFATLWTCRVRFTLLSLLIVTAATVLGCNLAVRFLYGFAATTYRAIDRPSRSRKVTILYTAFILGFFLLGVYSAVSPVLSAISTVVHYAVESYSFLRRAISTVISTVNIIHSVLQWIVVTLVWIFINAQNLCGLLYKLAELAWCYRGEIIYTGFHYFFADLVVMITLMAIRRWQSPVKKQKKKQHQD